MKFKLESTLPFAVLALILAITAGLGWVFFSSSSNPLTRVGGKKEPYVPKFSNPQTFEAPPEEGTDDFVFQYPERFNVTSQSIEGGGKRILVESTEPKKGFELVVLPFDEQGILTAERIRADIPDAVLENEKSVSVGQENIPAIAFNSNDENIGQTYEVWFTYEGYLYEALTYPEFAGDMEEILKTWQFK